MSQEDDFKWIDGNLKGELPGDGMSFNIKRREG